MARDALGEDAAPRATTDLRTVEGSLSRARPSVMAARARANSLPLRLVAKVPVAGRSAQALRYDTQAAELAFEAASKLARTLGAFPSPTEQPSFGLSASPVNLEPWVRAQAGLAQASALATQAARTANLAPTALVLNPIREATYDLRESLANLEYAAGTAAAVSELIPSMFGHSRTRRYLIVLQNLGEARATGGLVGGFAIVEATAGNLRLREVSPNGALQEAERDIPMPAWYRTRYDRFAARRHWSNVNMEPDFRVTGPLMAALFQETNRIAVSGVVAMDPVALQDLVGVTGPIVGRHGITVDGNNLARIVMKDAYELFPGADPNELGRKEFLADLATRIYRAAIEYADVSALAGALGEAARGRHVVLWSADARDQELLRRLAVDGGFPEPHTSFVGVYTQNGSANKMDYYMRRRISVAAHASTSGDTLMEMNVQLQNTGPKSGLPDYVMGSDDSVPEFSPGLVRAYTSIYLPPRARVVDFRVDGVMVAYESERAPHAAIASKFVNVGAGAQSTISISWALPSENHGVGDFRISILSQPTTVPDRVTFQLRAPGNVVYHEDRRSQAGRPAATLEFRATVVRPTLRRLVESLLSLAAAPRP